MNRGIRTAALALVLTLAVAWGLAVPAIALAHVPILEEPGRNDIVGTSAVPYPHAQAIPAPTKSLAIYGYLSPAEHLDAYSFMVPAPVVTQLQLLVPVRSGLEGFRPQLMLYAESTRARHFTAGPTTGPRPSFYEPFSAASFWESGAVTVTLVPGERYFLVVTPGNGSRRDGAYVIGVAGPESFTSAETLGTLAVLPQIWLGNWGGGPMRPGAIASITFAVILVPVAIWLLVRWRRRRRGVRAATANAAG